MEISAVFSELVSMLVINNLKFALQLFYVLNVYSIAFAALGRMREKRLHMVIILFFFILATAIIVKAIMKSHCAAVY